MESQVKRVARVTKENMVLQVQLAPRDLSEHLVLRVQMVSLDQEGSRVCLDRREMKEQEASLDLQAQSVCRACLVHLVRKVKLEMLENRDHLDHQVPEDHLDLQELMALKDLLVELEILVLLERREILVNPESLVFKENLVLQDQEENEERRARPVLQVQLDLLAPKVPLETTVQKEAQVQVVSPVTLAPLESLALLV